MSRSTQKQVNRENLLNHGVTLLMQQGYHGTGLQEILNAVNIPKGSFYNYFASKEEFAAAVIDHYIQTFINLLNEHLQRHPDNALLAMQNYYAELFEEMEKAQFKGGCLLGNLMGEIGDTSELCQKSLLSALHRYRDLYEHALSLAQQQGTIRRDKSAKAMADLLLDCWQGSLLRMKVEQSIKPLQQSCTELLGDFFKA